MKRRTFVLGMGTAAVGGSALLGSGAFSRTESQRSVVVETVGDEDAYMRLVYEDELEFGCEGELTLTLTNQFKETLDDVTITFEAETDDVTLGDPEVSEASNDDDDDGEEAESLDEGGPVEVTTDLEQGEAKEITVPITCNTAEESTTTVTFTVEGEGDETSVTVQDREVEVTCACPETGISFIAFCGEGIGSDAVEITNVDTENERIDWKLHDGSLQRVVLFGGFSSEDYGSGPYFLNFNDIEEITTGGDPLEGTVTVGNETEALSKDDAEDEHGQTPRCPCYAANEGVKFELDDDGEITEVEDGCGGPPN